MKNIYALRLILLLVIFASCTENSGDEAPRSSANNITSFTFSGLMPEAISTITDANSTIFVVVPEKADLTALVPTIELPEKATIIPASGVKQNFTNPVAYSVTAEDGTVRTYTVTVRNNFSVQSISDDEVLRGDTFFIEGTNFGSFVSDSIRLTNIKTGARFSLPAMNTSTATRLFFNVSPDVPEDDYSIILFVGDLSMELEDTINVTNLKVTIVSMSPLKAGYWQSIFITGTNFSETGNVVMMVKDGVQYRTEMVSESKTAIEFSNICNGGQYTVLVINADGESAETTEEITVEDFPEAKLVNKTTFKRGETIVVQGLNLQSQTPGFTFSANDQIRASFNVVATLNAEGTEMSYTIPETFPTGHFYLRVMYNSMLLPTYFDIWVND